MHERGALIGDKPRGFIQFVFREQAVNRIQLGLDSGRLTDGLARLFRRVKAADEMLGDFPHAPEGDVRRVFGLIGLQQPVMEGAEGRLAERLAAAERLRQGGVSDQHSSEDQRAGIRDLPHEVAAIVLAE